MSEKKTEPASQMASAEAISGPKGQPGSKSLLRFLWDNVRLQKNDFLQFALITASIWVVVLLAMLCIAGVSRESELMSFGAQGIAALAVVAILSLVQTGVRYSTEFAVGVSMSITRRKMLVAGAVLAALQSAAMLAETALLEVLWKLVFSAFGVEAYGVLSYMPLWGWAMLWFVPIGLGMLCGAILLRFGRRGFWVLYAIFMIVCLGPQLLPSLIPDVLLEMLLEQLPVIGWSAGGLSAVAGVAILRRAPILS